MEPFSRSCKSLEVIQYPRGAASQAGINQALDVSFKTKATSRALLRLWCQVLEGRNLLLQALRFYLPTAAKSLRVFREITIYTKFHHFSPWNLSLKRVPGCPLAQRVCSREEHLVPGRKVPVWNGKEKRKEKRERKLLGMMKFSHVFFHSLTLKY